MVVAFLGRLRWDGPLVDAGWLAWVIVAADELPPVEGGTTIMLGGQSEDSQRRR